MLDVNLQKELLDKHKVERIVGIDEVGRGAWAGPVVVGAFVWEPNTNFIEGVRDSKLIKLPEREELSEELSSNVYKFASGEAGEVDSLGIVQTIEFCMTALISEFDDGNTLFIVDGQFKGLPATKIFQAFKADNKYYSVAAAAILSKVYRDNLMLEASRENVGYGWETNRGYGTASHAKAIQTLGITSLHRKSFVPKTLLV